MRFIRTTDGTCLFYKDMGNGQPVVFSHGWPLDADAWDVPMMFMANNGFRTIAHDRRSHGRSDQTFDGNDVDTHADDLASLIEQLDLKDIILVGHATGGGEIARYMGRHGTTRVSRAVLVSAVPLLIRQTDANPAGLPRRVFDAIRDGVWNDRSQFYRDLSLPFYGYNLPTATPSQGIRDVFWLQGMRGGLKGQFDCIRTFSEVDYGPDLDRIDVPVLLIHGDADQIVPIGAPSRLTVKRLKNGVLKEYAGAPHGLVTTHQDRFNADLLAFARG